jgi:hypothetical protein
MRVRGLAWVVLVAAPWGGCKEPTTTLVFDVSQGPSLSSIARATLTFDDPTGRRRERVYRRHDLPPSLDVFLPEGMDRVSIHVQACGQTSLDLTGGGEMLTVSRRMPIALSPPTALRACPLDEDGGADTGETAADASQPDAGGDAVAEAGASEVAGFQPNDHGGATDGVTCDDAAVDAGDCPDPAASPDGAVSPDAGTISTACIDYCDGMMATCPGEYPGTAQCQAYCAQGGWESAGTTSGTTSPLDCRRGELSTAAGSAAGSLNQHQYCAAAGPTGGTGIVCEGTICLAFCTTWVHLCAPDSATTMADCEARCNNTDEAPCRLKWLVLAASDRRYCELTTFGSPCGGCPLH